MLTHNLRFSACVWPVTQQATDDSSLTLDTLATLQQEKRVVRVDPRIQRYLIQLCEATRQHESIALGVSPRGMLLWQRVAQAWAKLRDATLLSPRSSDRCDTRAHRSPRLPRSRLLFNR